MRVDPINLLLSPNNNLDKTFYFISGNEPSLIYKIKQFILEVYQKEGSWSRQTIKDISFYKNEIGLFEKRSVYLVSDVKNIETDLLNKISKDKNVFIFISENSPKNKQIKNIFLKRADSYLVDCYELSKDMKTKVLNTYINKHSLDLNKNLYWKVLDLLDNKYVLLEKELDKISLLDKNKIDEESIIRLISSSSLNLEKIFFAIFLSNKIIIDRYNRAVSSNSDIYGLFFIIKQYCSMVLKYENEKEFEKNIPKYLFKERGFLISFFNSFNYDKKIKLIKLMSRTEKVLREQHDFSILIGLKFLLSLKKLATS